MVWDLLFGTYFRANHRRPPADIGIREFMPPCFVHQIMWPFLTQEGKLPIEAGVSFGILRHTTHRQSREAHRDSPSGGTD